MPKEQTPGKEFCKVNVGTSNGHKLAVNKFGLESKVPNSQKNKTLGQCIYSRSKRAIQGQLFWFKKGFSEVGMVASVGVHIRKHLSPVHFISKLFRVIFVSSDWINIIVEREGSNK